MEFVTFHVALDQGETVHPNQTLRHQEYVSMIDMMFASARLFHPDARRVILTDEATRFGDVEARLDLMRRQPLDGSRLMLERAVAQERHVLQVAFDKPMAILDSDILINGSLDMLQAHDFDVALTWRPDNVAQPINGGFMLLNNRRPEVTRRFFSHYMDIYRSVYAEGHADWFGDQLALRDAVGLSVEELAERSIVEVDGCRILLLPCDTHNFSPENRLSQIATELRGKVVLHFKGERKRMMTPYWDAWLAPRGSLSPRLYLRALRERARLRREGKREEAELIAANTAAAREANS